MIAEQLEIVRDQVRAFEQKYGREENSVCILAVSKTRSTRDIAEALSAGQRDFGENYLQEALQKISELADEDITWHFIGPVQSNKTTAIAGHFCWLHSLERLKIARRLSQARPAGMQALNVCIQVNISGESSKSGIKAPLLGEFAEQVTALPGLELRGLMTMPAATGDFARQRQDFSELRKLFEQLNGHGYELDTLSMGTSNDLEAAIAEGATLVRIGTGVFGPRT